jgi:hypothetical protein
MGNKPHHIGSIGGGINLSKAKTPHDADIKYMPVDNRANTPFHQAGSDSSYGIDGYVTNRKDLKQARKKYKIKNLSKEHETLKSAYDMGQKVNEKKLFRVEDKLSKKEQRYTRKFGESPYSLVDQGRKSKSSTPPKKSIKKQIGKAARALEAKAPKVIQDYFKGLRKRQ